MPNEKSDDAISKALTSEVDSNGNKVSKSLKSNFLRRPAYSFRTQALAITLCLTVVCTFAIWRPWESKTGEHDNVAMVLGNASDRQADSGQESRVEELSDSDLLNLQEQGNQSGAGSRGSGELDEAERFYDKDADVSNSLGIRTKRSGTISHDGIVQSAQSSPAQTSNVPDFDSPNSKIPNSKIPNSKIPNSSKKNIVPMSLGNPGSQDFSGAPANRSSGSKKAAQPADGLSSPLESESGASPGGGMSEAESSGIGSRGIGGGFGGGFGGGGIADKEIDVLPNKVLEQQKFQRGSANGRERLGGMDLKKKGQFGVSPSNGMKESGSEDNQTAQNRRARKQVENGGGSGSGNMAPKSKSATNRSVNKASDPSDSEKPIGGRIANSTQQPQADSYSGKNGNPANDMGVKSGEEKFGNDGSVQGAAERNSGQPRDMKLSQLKPRGKASEADGLIERKMKKKTESFSIKPESSAAKPGESGAGYEKSASKKTEDLKSERAIEPAMESKVSPRFIESDPKGKESSSASFGGKPVVDGEKDLKEAIEKEQEQKSGQQTDKSDMPSEELKWYKKIVPVHENDFVQPLGTNALSTFSIDTDTASYTNLRQKLRNNVRPNPAEVRIEEMLNYFSYAYPKPKRNDPFSVTMEIASCPWTPGNKLLRVGMKAREIANAERPASNLVFLIDVSGSMRNEKKLPLLQKGLSSLVDQLREDDYVSIVTYSDTIKNPLQPTDGSKKAEIKQVINSLTAGGSTNGSGGLEESYRLAEQYFLKGGTNRIVMGTDGDFNFGISDDDELVEFIKNKTENSKVFLTVCGFGTDNFKDQKVQKMAQNGNGKVFYIDSFEEAKRVFVEKISGGLVTMAKDVKLQLLFNPRTVQSYRLIGYENRMLEAQDFDNDQKDAGEMDAGDRVTALYEIVPADSDLTFSTVADANTIDLKYQVIEEKKYSLTKDAGSNEIATLRIRFKQPESDESEKREFPVENNSTSFNRASKDLQFASSVAGLGLLLRNSKHRGSLNFEGLKEYATGALSDEKDEARKELLELIQRAKEMYR